MGTDLDTETKVRGAAPLAPEAQAMALLLSAFFEDLAEKAHLRPAEVNVKALGLFKLATDARAAGNRIAILAPDDEIVQGIGGFESADSNLQAVGR